MSRRRWPAAQAQSRRGAQRRARGGRAGGDETPGRSTLRRRSQRLAPETRQTRQVPHEAFAEAWKAHTALSDQKKKKKKKKKKNNNNNNNETFSV